MSGVATLKLRGEKRHFDEMAIDLPLPTQSCSPNRFPLRPPPLKRGRSIPPPHHSSSSSTVLTNHPRIPSSSSPSKHLFTSSSSSSSTSRLALTSINNNISNNNNNINNNNNNNNSNNINNINNPSSKQHKQSSNNSSSCTSKQQHQPLPQQRQHLNDDKNSQQQHPISSNNNNNNNENSKSVMVSAEDLSALARHLPKKLKKLVERLATGQVEHNEKLFTLSDLREIVQSVVNEHDQKLREQFTITLNERLAEQFRDFTKFNEDYVSRQLRGTDVAYLS